MVAVPICLRFDRQPACRAFSFAWAKTGKRIAARMAIMAITTSSSISVNAGLSNRRIRSLLSVARVSTVRDYLLLGRWRLLPVRSHFLYTTEPVRPAHARQFSSRRGGINLAQHFSAGSPRQARAQSRRDDWI